ncbi:hypothetical protein AB0K43_29990 [Kitasatospora sp. NPDC049258]|uniref:hypothetical protein n=1 Tax=Kitasatospora sp. NPDC049258 TaxID=3155394 RepID=UPI00341D3DC0
MTHRRTARACEDLGLLPAPFSPLIAALLETYCHTRTVAALARRESNPQEYRTAARAAVRDLLEGWLIQSHGLGTIDDLLTDSPDAAVPRPRTGNRAPGHRTTGAGPVGGR